MTLNQVVFVFTSGGWRIGRVSHEEGTRVQVEHPGGDRVTYAEGRIAHVSQRRAPTIGALDAYESELRELVSSIDLAAAWEMLTAEQPGEDFDAEALTELCLTYSGDSADDATAWALQDDPVYFKRKKNGRYALRSVQTVNDKLRAVEKEARERRELDAMKAWLADPQSPRPPECGQALDAIKTMLLFDDASPEARLGRSLVRAARPDSSESDQALAWELLLSLGEWHPDENLFVHRAGLRRSFGAAVLEAASAGTEPVTPLSDYTDYRHVPCLAIDDAFTTEVDDALAIVRTGAIRTVYVFIADASSYVPEDGPLDREARRRHATVYVPEGKIPMLPEALGDQAASLLEGVDRRALAFILTLDDEGHPLDFRVEQALVRVAARLTYDTVDAILEGAEHPHRDMTVALFDAAEQLRTNRREGGSITLDRREVTVYASPGQEPTLEPYRTDDKARRMVAEWMIASCAHTAQWCAERYIPAVYRSQPAPTPTPDIPLDRALRPFELQKVLRTLRKACLTTDPQPHSGLGVPCYTQISSPLRRYQDLLMHRQLIAFLRDGQPRYTPAELEAGFEHAAQCQSLYGSVERDSRRYWHIKQMEPLVGQPLDVEVIRQTGRGWLVEVVRTGLAVPWRTRRKVALGDLLSLTIKEANARENTLRFEP